MQSSGREARIVDCNRTGVKQIMNIRNICFLALLLANFISLAIAEKFPEGTRVMVRIGNTLSSRSAHKGQVWEGSLTRDVVVRGKIIAKAGDPVKGRVSYVKPSGRLHAPGEISVRLASIDGDTMYSSRASRKGKGHAASNTAKIGGGAGAGALIGALEGPK
jgi:hypothetical protein